MNRSKETGLSTAGLAIGYRHHRAEEKRLAEGLDLTLRPGEFVCLLGPNGTGKSTLIRTLSGMQPPLAGGVQLGDRALENIRPRERARGISVVLTEPPPAGLMDAYALVSLGRHPYSGWLGGLDACDHDRIEWAFDAVGARSLARRQVAELSDGERQRVSIARALAQEAGIMLLDEPTAFLDLPGRMELMSLLRDLAHREQLAMLSSTHDLDLALRFADRLWILTATGKLLQGPPEALALAGDFADAFAGENLDWDASSGSFRAHPHPLRLARVEGEGAAALWTRRALERLGYGPAGPDNTADLTVRVSPPSCWQLHDESDNNREFTSIEGLIDFVQTL